MLGDESIDEPDDGGDKANRRSNPSNDEGSNNAWSGPGLVCERIDAGKDEVLGQGVEGKADVDETQEKEENPTLRQPFGLEDPQGVVGCLKHLGRCRGKGAAIHLQWAWPSLLVCEKAT